MKELNILFQSGSNLYVTITRLSDAKVWQTTSSTFVTPVGANIANYDVPLTDNGLDFYYADFPSAIDTDTYVVAYYVQASATPATPSTSDTIIPPPEEIEWGGTGVTGPVGGETTTVGTLVTIARVTLRNAGLADSSDTNYDLELKHIGIQLLLKDFVRRTKCTSSIDSFTITAADDDVTLAGITGFHTERIGSIWINGQDSPLATTDIEAINSKLANDTSTGLPCEIAFSTTTGVGKVFRTPDATYTGKVRWSPPLTTWTAGDTGVAARELNIPGDLAENAVEKGIIWQLQKNQPEHAAIVAASKADYEAFVARNLGAGNLGVRSVEVIAPSCGTSRWGL